MCRYVYTAFDLTKPPHCGIIVVTIARKASYVGHTYSINIKSMPHAGTDQGGGGGGGGGGGCIGVS